MDQPVSHRLSSSTHGISGSLTALVTPFRDSELDLPVFARLVLRQLAHGTAGLLVCGSTGEAQSLSPAEFSRAIALVVEIAGGRVPVIAGCTSSSTAVSLKLAAAATRAEADLLHCAVPPCVNPTQDGIIAHIRAIADNTDLPVLLSDVPGRSGVAIADDTVARLFDAGRIMGIEDATADLSRPARLHALCGGGLVQLSGDDATAAGYRAMGGDGCISVIANVTPALCAVLHRAWDNGDRSGFAATRDLLQPLHAALSPASNPIVVKAALNQLGLCSDEVRPPLTRATPAMQVPLVPLLLDLMVSEKHAAGCTSLALASWLPI